MDWDEPKAKSTAAPVLGEALDRLSVDEMQARIEALHVEIARVEQEVKKRAAHHAQADQFFKS